VLCHGHLGHARARARCPWHVAGGTLRSAAINMGEFKMGNFSVAKKKEQGHVTYHLKDAKRKMAFSLAPDIGNWGYSLKSNGKEVFYPRPTFEQYIKE